MDVGYWIRYYRKKRGLTGKEFAKLCGCSHGSVRQIEDGSRYPSIKTFQKMVRVLNVPSDFLFRDVNRPAGIYTLNTLLSDAKLTAHQRECVIAACIKLCEFNVDTHR